MLRKIVRGLPRSCRCPRPTSFHRVSAKGGEVRPFFFFGPVAVVVKRCALSSLKDKKLGDWSALVYIDIICSRLQRVRSRHERLRFLN